MRHLRFRVAYDGTSFHGWQVQPGLPTIQATLEEIFTGIEGKPVHVAASGRTDAGVHAEAQVAAVLLTNPIPCDNLRRAVNRLLPASIRISHIEETHPGFHPRYDAVAKTYEYRIYRDEVCPPWERPYVHHHPFKLDWDRFAALARVYEGEHDFTAFAAADDRDALGRSKVRTIFSSIVQQDGPRVRFRVRGSGFLKHMVRNLVGTLIEAGRGNHDEASLRALLRPKPPRKAGPTAPPQGLWLMSVEYPEVAPAP